MFAEENKTLLQKRKNQTPRFAGFFFCDRMVIGGAVLARFLFLENWYNTSMNKGKFIVVEGGDGSGKGTQLSLLRKELGDENIVWTREPGGTQIGEKIRELLLDMNSAGMKARTELLLFYTSRSEHMEEKIIPALLSGKHVISDRFSLSTLAYQIYGRERMEYLEFCKLLDKNIVGEFAPEMTVFFDIDPARGLERVQKGRSEKKDRLDSEPLLFHTRLREGYLKEIAGIPHEIINADRKIEDIYADFSRVVNLVFKR